MKDEIKKKIEDTADNAYPSELETNEYYAFQEGAEYGYSLAQQSCVCSSITKGWDNKEDERWNNVGEEQNEKESDVFDLDEVIDSILDSRESIDVSPDREPHYHREDVIAMMKELFLQSKTNPPKNK
jgi:hypothetical protein